MSNITNPDKNRYFIKEHEHNFDKILFCFANKSFTLNSIINEYLKELYENTRLEILPGIWLTDSTNYTKDKISSKKINKKIKWKFYVEVNNKVNFFKVFQRQDIISNPNKIRHEVVSEQVVINPNLLPYPDSMGGGRHGCAVWDIFTKIGLFDTLNYDYNLFSLDQILKNVTVNQRLKDKCLNQNTCLEILKKYKNGEYKSRSEENYYINDIDVNCIGSTYSVNDGNHRICVAKRFDIESIPILLNRTIINKNDIENDYDIYYEHECFSCKKVMTAYRTIINKLGLTIEDANYLIQTSIDEYDLVKFLEEKNGKRIDEIIILTNK